AEPLVLIVADHDERVGGFFGKDAAELLDGRLGRLVSRPRHLGGELAADPRDVLARLPRELREAPAIQIAEAGQRLGGRAQHGTVRGADAEGDLCHALRLSSTAAVPWPASASDCSRSDRSLTLQLHVL